MYDRTRKPGEYDPIYIHSQGYTSHAPVMCQDPNLCVNFYQAFERMHSHTPRISKIILDKQNWSFYIKLYKIQRDFFINSSFVSPDYIWFFSYF